MNTLPSSLDTKTWEQAAATVLRKVGKLGAEERDELVWERLTTTTTTLDGVAIPPLGVAGDSHEVPGSRRNVSRAGAWDVRVATRGGDGALDELETGAHSLWLTLDEGVDADAFDRILDGVLIDLAPIVLAAVGDQVDAARAFCSWLADHDGAPAEGTNLGADPIGARVLGQLVDDGDGGSLEARVGEIASLARGTGVLGFVVDATVVHDQGASDAQELGYSLAAGAAYLRALTEAGLSVEEALDLLEFRYAATDEQFVTIAKFRAARQLWSRVAEICGANSDRQLQRQHAVTSRPMMTRYDPWVNMLRTTVAAFAAGTGGADSITVLPFDSALGQPDEFGRRIARNTSSLLIEESQVAKVADPAGGSYAVERLTDELAHAAWTEFGLIEEAGGVLPAFSDSSADPSASSAWGRIREVARRREAEVATRKRPITGVSEFPNPDENLPEREPHDDGARAIASYAAAFEALRDLPEAHVYLATMGPLAEHTARAGVATNLFGAAGISVDNPGPLLDTNDVLSSYARQPVVCLVGSDRAYAEWGAELVAGLRQEGAQHVVVMGKPGDLAVEDSFVLGDDAVAFLSRTREALR